MKTKMTISKCTHRSYNKNTHFTQFKCQPVLLPIITVIEVSVFQRQK